MTDLAESEFVNRFNQLAEEYGLNIAEGKQNLFWIIRNKVLNEAKADAPKLKDLDLKKNGFFYVGEWAAWFERWFGK